MTGRLGHSSLQVALPLLFRASSGLSWVTQAFISTGNLSIDTTPAAPPSHQPPPPISEALCITCLWSSPCCFSFPIPTRMAKPSVLPLHIDTALCQTPH